MRADLQHQRDAMRVRVTLLTIVVVALVLSLVEATLALRTEEATLGLWVLAAATATFALALLGPVVLIDHDLARAVFIGCAAILGIQVVYLVFYPRAYPAITIAAFVVVALALSFVSGRALLQVVLASWAIAIAAIVWGSVGESLASVPHEADVPILVASGLAAVTVGMVLLWQFARNTTAALAESRAVNAELAAANEKLRDIEGMKSQFINTAAHELNTPMTPLMLQLDVLKARQQEAKTTPEIQRSMQVIERNILRLGQLVREMLDMARVQSGRMALQRESFPLRSLLQESVDDFAGQAQARGVSLALAPGDDALVDGDRQRVVQVVSNLLSNALRVTPPGGAITLGVRRDGDSAVAAVTDSGVGLSPEQLGALFQPFTRLHENVAGTLGIGLYIARGLVEGMGGTLWAESPGLGQGATFSFKLPRTGAPSPEGPAR